MVMSYIICVHRDANKYLRRYTYARVFTYGNFGRYRYSAYNRYSCYADNVVVSLGDTFFRRVGEAPEQINKKYGHTRVWLCFGENQTPLGGLEFILQYA